MDQFSMRLWGDASSPASLIGAWKTVYHPASPYASNVGEKVVIESGEFVAIVSLPDVTICRDGERVAVKRDSALEGGEPVRVTTAAADQTIDASLPSVESSNPYVGWIFSADPAHKTWWIE